MQPEQMPKWKSRGLPGPGHVALQPLVGTWRVQLSIHATFGRSPDQPPIVSDDLRCTREWVADGRYLEDTTVGTAAGGLYWRKGWLGHSNMDRRYEWVTIDAVNSDMMIYESTSGCEARSPINLSGAFLDQGVSGEEHAGKSVGMRTLIQIDNNDRHTIELYFTPPGKPEVLATRQIYTRVTR